VFRFPIPFNRAFILLFYPTAYRKQVSVLFTSHGPFLLSEVCLPFPSPSPPARRTLSGGHLIFFPLRNQNPFPARRITFLTLFLPWSRLIGGDFSWRAASFSGPLEFFEVFRSSRRNKVMDNWPHGVHQSRWEVSLLSPVSHSLRWLHCS